MASEHILSRIQQALNALAFETCVLPPNDYVPFHQLLVALDEDVQTTAESADLILQLFFTNDAVVSEDPLQSVLTALQFVITLPLDLEEKDLLSVHRFSGFFSEQMPMGHFGIDKNGFPYYRYVLLSPDQAAITDEVVVEIVELLGMFINIYAQQVEQFILDDMSLDALIDDTYEALRSLASEF